MAERLSTVPCTICGKPVRLAGVSYTCCDNAVSFLNREFRSATGIYHRWFQSSDGKALSSRPRLREVSDISST